jgi:hypothetical protein
MKGITVYFYEGDECGSVGDEIAIVDRISGPPTIGAVISLEAVKFIVTYVEWHLDLRNEIGVDADVSWVDVRVTKHGT